MKGILLAMHGGVSADGAVQVASLLAARVHVALMPLVVFAPIPILDYGFGATYVPTPEDEAAVRAALMTSAREQFRRCGVTDAIPELRTGVVSSEIAATARAHGAGLIVTGLGAHGILDRTLGGETALHLAQDASTPVLAVPASVTAIPRRVIAAIDFSPTSVRAAHTAAGWLRDGDELHIVSVVPKRSQTARATSTIDRSVGDRLTQVGRELGVAAGVRVDVTERAGDAARTLLDHARQIDADLITLGSHGYGAVKRLVLGSVASKIIRVATCAILVAPIGCLDG
jgi:nucleotide-binding universal stress UspA family protein